MDSLGTLNPHTASLFRSGSVTQSTERQFHDDAPGARRSTSARGKALARMRIAGLGVIAVWYALFLAAQVTHLAVHATLGVGMALLVYGALKAQDATDRFACTRDPAPAGSRRRA